MATYYVNEEMLGDDATREDAQRMVEFIRQHGYDVAYGDHMNRPEDAPPPDVWEVCLELVQHVKRHG